MQQYFLEHVMATRHAGDVRPPLHLLASESDLVAGLALQAEHRNPVVAAMLLEEIERAELHEADTMPADAVMLGSEVSFVDERSKRMRTVKLVLPVDANIAEGRISIMTPMGAALYGLRAGDAIDWPDNDGNARRITIKRVSQPEKPLTN
jgi:regulator of nucleoside diphosphate kinase